MLLQLPRPGLLAGVCDLPSLSLSGMSGSAWQRASMRCARLSMLCQHHLQTVHRCQLGLKGESPLTGCATLSMHADTLPVTKQHYTAFQVALKAQAQAATAFALQQQSCSSGCCWARSDHVSHSISPPNPAPASMSQAQQQHKQQLQPQAPCHAWHHSSSGLLPLQDSLEKMGMDASLAVERARSRSQSRVGRKRTRSEGPAAMDVDAEAGASQPPKKRLHSAKSRCADLPELQGCGPRLVAKLLLLMAQERVLQLHLAVLGQPSPPNQDMGPWGHCSAV